ncbi:MAG: hypothetical protein R3E01_36505 [Pirellulaceae bacterium]
MEDSSVVVEGNFARKAVTEAADEYQAFSFGRIGVKPQLTLLFRKATGEVHGFAYADLRGISTLDEDRGFTIRFDSGTVKIEGRNLRQLFQYICLHRAAEIVEIDEQMTLQLPHDRAVVWLVKF